MPPRRSTTITRHPVIARRLAAALVVACAAGSAPAAVAQEPPAPDLQVLFDDPERVVQARASGRARVSVPAMVAVRGAPLQQRASRRGSRITIEQVLGAPPAEVRRATGLASDGLPLGVADFLRLSVTDGRGRTVARRERDFCPNFAFFHFDPLDPASPPESSLGGGIGCGMPLALSVVWGLDPGWAAPASLKAVSLRPGRYRAHVTVDPERELADRDRSNDTASFAFVVRARRPRARAATRRPVGPRARTAQAPTSPPAPGALPDLRAVPAFNAVLDRIGRRNLLRFDAIIWNGGAAPLLVEGEAAGRNRMTAFQRLASDRPRIGELRFDVGDGHHHWHYTGLARYRLLDRLGRPVRAAAGRKVGWCFLGTDAIDLSLDGAPRVLGRGTRESECGRPASASVEMALPVGWGDRYSADLPGQFIDVTRVPAGTYFIEIMANADGRLIESDAANNQALRKVQLRRPKGRRPRLVLAPVDGVDVEELEKATNEQLLDSFDHELGRAAPELVVADDGP